MNRRHYLAGAGVALSSIVAGCISEDDSKPACRLSHEVVESAEDYTAEEVEPYRFENLSDEARHVFEAALDDGGYATTNRSLEPSEFQYTDTTSVYNVTYRNETHTLLTYTGEGCELE